VYVNELTARAILEDVGGNGPSSVRVRNSDPSGWDYRFGVAKPASISTIVSVMLRAHILGVA
jgi:hypothetical protein